jgi:hypothetical protein
VKLILSKSGNTLSAVDALAEAAIAKIKDGAHVQCTVTQARNPNMHRLYWALVAKVFDNVDHDRYPTIEDLHTAIKISAGHRLRVHMPNDVVAFAAKSIAFDKMSQIEFREFFDNVCDVVSRHFLPGLPVGELKAEVESMIGLTT